MAVDLNADLGESFGHWILGDDDAMLDEVTSANVACGFHAGDPATLLRTCRGAVARGIVIGAQFGYPDLGGFGRRFIDMAPEDLHAAVIYQVGALDALAKTVGGRVRYVKPHGALYHATVEHEGQAAAVVDAVVAVDPGFPVLGLPGSQLFARAERAGLRTVAEYFVDRAYTPEGRLVDRRDKGAVISDPAVAARRAVEAARTGAYGSLCVHGDSPGAVTMTRRVRNALLEAGIGLRPFVDGPS